MKGGEGGGGGDSVFFVNFGTRKKELQYAHVEGIAHCVHCLLVHAKTKI
jgi:hypothetical protein